jgi:bifunctional ADP-heptose synthase (sugar kinase/adenylyltransferase)
MKTNKDDLELIKYTDLVFPKILKLKTDKASTKICSIKNTIEQVDAWKKQGSTIVFVAGVFDILHLNHLQALEYYRLLGARHFVEKNKKQELSIVNIAASSKVRLVISMDSDLRVSNNKSSEKTKRPILSWKSRALMLLKQSMQSSNDSNHSLVDFIIRHGVDTCESIQCAHDDNITIAEEIKPDVMILNNKSLDSIKLVKKSRKLDDIEIILIDENNLFINDSLLDGPIKTTSILDRA